MRKIKLEYLKTTSQNKLKVLVLTVVTAEKVLK